MADAVESPAVAPLYSYRTVKVAAVHLAYMVLDDVVVMLLARALPEKSEASYQPPKV